MISSWNDAVDLDDDVYILGDFGYKGNKKDYFDVLEKLRGRKHLIVGNHDGIILKDESIRAYFDTVAYIQENTERYEGRDIKVIMCHYPMAFWDYKRHGSFHIYGHIHRGFEAGALEYMTNNYPYALNAWTCLSGYRPVCFEELLKNNSVFNKRIEMM